MDSQETKNKNLTINNSASIQKYEKPMRAGSTVRPRLATNKKIWSQTGCLDIANTANPSMNLLH